MLRGERKPSWQVSSIPQEDGEDGEESSLSHISTVCFTIHLKKWGPVEIRSNIEQLRVMSS
jgi:hypothetical protein